MSDRFAAMVGAVADEARGAAARVQPHVTPIRPRPAACRCGGAGVVFGRDATGHPAAWPCRCAATAGCPTCEGRGAVHETRGLYTFAADCPACVVPQRRAKMWTEAGFAERHADAWIEAANPLHADVARWSDGWRPGGPGLFITGAPGVGKSHAMVAGVRRLILRSPRPPRVRYVNIKVLMKALKRAMDRGDKPSALLDPLESATLLVLDEIGVGRLTEYRVETVSTLVDDRYEAGRTTCFVTNHDPEQLEAALDRVDPVAGARLVDRMREMSAYVRAAGPSRRAWATLPGAPDHTTQE